MSKQSPTIIPALAPRRFYLLALIMCLFLFFLVLPNRVSTQAPETCVQPPSGIIAWWPMDETSGTNVARYSRQQSRRTRQWACASSGTGGWRVAVRWSKRLRWNRDSDLWAFGSNDFTIESLGKF